jgi:hypothetical protein
MTGKQLNPKDLRGMIRWFKKGTLLADVSAAMESREETETYSLLALRIYVQFKK